MRSTELGRSRGDGGAKLSERPKTAEEWAAMTKEEADAEVDAIINRIWGPPPKPKPKVVTRDGKVVRDATVRVGPADDNYPNSDEGVVRVRRSDFVTVRIDLWEEQQRQKRLDRLLRRQLDPCRLGLYGPVDEDDD
jgi:hypothetical protein